MEHPVAPEPGSWHSNLLPDQPLSARRAFALPSSLQTGGSRFVLTDSTFLNHCAVWRQFETSDLRQQQLVHLLRPATTRQVLPAGARLLTDSGRAPG